MLDTFPVDKRKTPRFQVSIPVRNTHGTTDDKFFSRTFDISSNGIGLISEKELPLGQKIELCLFMPDNNEEIRATGKPVWICMAGSGKYRIGISLDQSSLKPIPLVLRSIRMRSRYYG